MNYFTERLNYLIKGIKSWDSVLESRYNALKRETIGLTPDVEAEADRRLSICLECPFNSLNARISPEYSELMKIAKLKQTPPYLQAQVKQQLDQNPPHYVTSREETHCSHCSCPVHYKVLAMQDGCGITTYNNTYGENQPLKWEKYEK